MRRTKRNVIIYLTGIAEKDNAVRKYCKKQKVNVIDEIMPDSNQSYQHWNLGITDLYFATVDAAANYTNVEIITYDLENLFWCLNDQVAIVLFLFEAGANFFTIKEGLLTTGNVIDINLNIDKKSIKDLKKYWVEEN